MDKGRFSTETRTKEEGKRKKEKEKEKGYSTALNAQRERQEMQQRLERTFKDQKPNYLPKSLRCAKKTETGPRAN